MEAMSEGSMMPSDEQLFIENVVEIVIESLDIHYNDRRLFKPLLKKLLSEKMDSRWGDGARGLLQHYAANKIDKATQRLIEELELGEDIKVNHDNSDYSKFRDIVKAIKLKYSITEQRKEKLQNIQPTIGTIAPSIQPITP